MVIGLGGAVTAEVLRKLVLYMNPNRTRKLIGYTSILLGAAWAVLIVFKPVQSVFLEGRHWLDVTYLLTLLPILIPGLLFSIFGFSLSKGFSLRSLKWITGTAVGVGVLLLSSTLAISLPDTVPETEAGFILIFLCTLAALPLYIYVVRTVCRLLEEEVPSRMAFVSRGVVLLLCWQLWILLFSVFSNLVPEEDPILRALSVIAPMGIAYAVFRFANWKLRTWRSGQKL